ncbi:hypothetical protein N752_03465 [Desulforamulus aquiferis]|nr:hypothetical protein [Desulforamulus aquiferis]RYD06747.1 hypothetical protein N752_03465 [Desulforamulus aquiferis]
MNTFRILPYVPNTASVICDFLSKDTHQDTGLCPRTMLKKLLSKIDYQVNVAFENEFYLLKRDEQGRLVPFDNSLCFTTSGMNQGHQVISDIIKALQAQQLTVEKYLAEYGPGQHEIAVKYSDALRACDNQVILGRLSGAFHRIMAWLVPSCLRFSQIRPAVGHIYISASGVKGKMFSMIQRMKIN